MNKNNLLFLQALFLTIFLSFSHTAQSQSITLNDGFEGEPQRGVPPRHWHNSQTGPSSTDTQPGIFDNTKPPSEGNTYISLVTRKVGPPGSRETVWADLLEPLQQGKCYKIAFDLSLSEEFNAVHNFVDLYYFNEKPCVFQIIGFNNRIHNTTDREFLWESEPLYEDSWQTFVAEFTPLNNTYERIALRPDFFDQLDHKNTVVLVDNLRFQMQPDIFTYENGILNIPEGASDISWYYEGQLVPDANDTQMPVLGSGLYEARFFDENDCHVVTSERIDLDFDHFKCYPVPTSDWLTVECFAKQSDTFRFRIYSELGQLVHEEQVDMLDGINKVKLDLQRLAAAGYFLQVIRPGLENLSCRIAVVHY